MSERLPNPADPEQSLKRPLLEDQLEEAHPPQPILPEDSAVTKAEKVERNGVDVKEEKLNVEAPSAKRIKMEASVQETTANGREDNKVDSRDKVKGIALVKPE
jgi:tRNA-dihydrouridine synthase 3